MEYLQSQVLGIGNFQYLFSSYFYGHTVRFLLMGLALYFRIE